MRYRLRTLLVALTLGPPVLALEWWYWKESSLALLVLLVVILSLILWLLNALVWALARIYEALCQLIGVKPPGVFSHKSRIEQCDVS
jgi:predicted PurR-regulated permease PerM